MLTQGMCVCVGTCGMCVHLDPNPLLPTALLCCLSFGSDINFSPPTPSSPHPACLLPSVLCTPVPEVTADSVTHIQLWHGLIICSLLQHMHCSYPRYFRYCYWTCHEEKIGIHQNKKTLKYSYIKYYSHPSIEWDVDERRI